MAISKYIIKRFGDNSYSADTNWIKETRVINNSETIGDGWETISYSKLQRQLKLQNEDYKNWQDSLYNTDIMQIDTTKYSDWKAARKALSSLISTKGFDNCNEYEKEKACEWFCVTPDTMINFYTGSTQNLSLAEAVGKKISNGANFNINSIQSRQYRWFAAFTFARNVISRSNLELISYDIISNEYETTYINLGREGTTQTNYEGETDGEGVYDYIMGTGSYQDNLIKDSLGDRITEPLYGYTAQNIVDKLMDILENGNY